MIGKAKQILSEINRLDQAVYAAVATSPTPSLDTGLRKLSNAANYSRISGGISVGLAVFGGSAGRKAAFRGMASIGVTSAVLNALVKPVARRARPDREGAAVPEARHVRMPTSHSFPSGHSASAFAYAVGVGHVLPWSIPPLVMLAAAVAYSRVHTGVHYPGDVVIGSLSGFILAEATNTFLDSL
ncbi:MAG: phosphatase PAP2 family protein [Solirubrobacterales bacterium]|nr:phosphatase PAP2 family protein [Solirubrobacterales bacterium]MCB0868221.1 phosphatase PAP2 family protein [Solirubrobacterales bacterium]